VARLLLVHGHCSFQRTAYIVQQSFYKSMVIASVQFLYNMYTLFCGVTYWDSFSLTMYNGFYTLPLTFLYVMDVHLSPKTLLNIPELYCIAQRSRYFNPTTFVTFLVRGVLQGVASFYIAYFATSGCVLLRDGYTFDSQTSFVALYFGTVIVVLLTVFIESHSIVSIQWAALWVSIVSLYGSFFGYSELFSGFEFFGAFLVLCRNPVFHLVELLIIVLTLVIFGSYCCWKFWFYPNRLQIQRGFQYHVARMTSPLWSRWTDDSVSSFWLSMKPTGCNQPTVVDDEAETIPNRASVPHYHVTDLDS
jgi:phospholipid-translocating ATPase